MAALYAEGNDSFVDDDFETALSKFTAAIKEDPSKPDYFVKRSATHAKLGNFIDALEDASAALKLAPQSDKALLRKGCVCESRLLRLHRHGATTCAPGQRLGGFLVTPSPFLPVLFIAARRHQRSCPTKPSPRSAPLPPSAPPFATSSTMKYLAPLPIFGLKPRTARTSRLRPPVFPYLPYSASQPHNTTPHRCITTLPVPRLGPSRPSFPHCANSPQYCVLLARRVRDGQGGVHQRDGHRQCGRGGDKDLRDMDAKVRR